MKKLILILLSFAFFGCGNDVENRFGGWYGCPPFEKDKELVCANNLKLVCLQQGSWHTWVCQ